MTSPIRYKDCKEWRLYAAASTGVYDIYPDGKTRITVFCDQVTDAGGWTVVLSRNGSFDGNKTWDDYKRGFGNLRGNFWLGNENIYLLTVNKINEVWFKLQSTKGVWFYASYRNVNIGTESDGYRFHMNVTSYYGNAGNSFKRNFGRLDGIRFTTIDMDNDYSSRNCAIYHGGDCMKCLRCNGVLNPLLCDRIKICDQTEQPPYSPDLAPSDFHLFPKMKEAISGTHFHSYDDVIFAVDGFLVSLDKEFFNSEALNVARGEAFITIKCVRRFHPRIFLCAHLRYDVINLT
ncbi:hypothetical protein FSP39_025043 [Pinctada imbricata]|uniref:Fibrinogen C-terminal domain-containing protein n=1 Tax=Pinctada imbricata TaxID=66713 RepID=A0AA89BXN7_PINIB|nr:hypothetical protein FSP39_025043 [Pinctada imbricata]